MPPVSNISEVDPRVFHGILSDENNTCTIETTVPTGMEDVCAEEVQEKLKCSAVKATGRIFFDIKAENIPEVLQLRSVENVHVVIGMERDFPFSSEREVCFEHLYHLVEKLQWKKGFLAWQKIFGDLSFDPLANVRPLELKFQEPSPLLDLRLMKKGSPVAQNLLNNIQPKTDLNAGAPNSSKEVSDKLIEFANLSFLSKESEGKRQAEGNNIPMKSDKEEEFSNAHKKLKADHSSNGERNKVEQALLGPKFRVSCYRSGSDHMFGSSEAARQLGGAINESFGWPVDLKNFDVEVILNIANNFVYTSLALTHQPLYKRNLVSFGPTNLRATLSYALVHLTRPVAGDVILDHMCGGASITIEGSLAFPSTFHLGGDIHVKAVTRARENIVHNAKEKSISTDVALWDATCLPLRDNCVDIVVSDLPFGKRCGTRMDNRVLYLKALQETARVTRPAIGRAVLLTHDRNSMIKNLVKVKHLWKNSSCRTINIGGLGAAVFLLHRTKNLFSSASDESPMEQS